MLRVQSRSKQRAGERGFNRSSAVASIAEPLFATAAGKAFASDCGHAIVIQGPSFVRDQLFEEVGKLGFGEVVKDDGVRESGGHAVVVGHELVHVFLVPEEQVRGLRLGA